MKRFSSQRLARVVEAIDASTQGRGRFARRATTADPSPNGNADEAFANGADHNGGNHNGGNHNGGGPHQGELAGHASAGAGATTYETESATQPDGRVYVQVILPTRRPWLKLRPGSRPPAPRLPPSWWAEPGRHTGRHTVALEARRRTPRTVYDRRPGRRTTLLLLAAILAVGALLRVWEISAVGLNSDEAVYNGQGASIAGNDALAPYFPTFRAHPLLFQTLLSIGFHTGNPELFGRLAAAALGLATVGVAYMAGNLMYGRRAGLIAAAILALMPYHVIVTRQILLDGPMVLWSTVSLYLLARYAATERRPWFYAAAATLGLTMLSKEGSIILLGAVYAFLALTPALRTGARHIAGACALFAAVVSTFPISLWIAGKTGTGGNFLAWQLFRRPNHDWLFYPAVVPVAIGLAVVAAAGLGLWVLRRDASWRETLLLSWIVVPVAFFQIFPVKGFQYLLPIAPAVALLAARFLANWRPTVPFNAPARQVAMARWAMPAFCVIVLVSLLIPAWSRVQPSKAATFLAGSGGVPGGREAGRWIAVNVPRGARMMSLGPSMANILQYYGRRKIYGLSVSPNPLHRNPVYEPMNNPDRLIRDNELQYVVWDAFSADRSPFFARKLLRYVERYHGRAVHVQTVPRRTPAGKTARKAVIVIYEVRP